MVYRIQFIVTLHSKFSTWLSASIFFVAALCCSHQYSIGSCRNIIREKMIYNGAFIRYVHTNSNSCFVCLSLNSTYFSRSNKKPNRKSGNLIRYRCGFPYTSWMSINYDEYNYSTLYFFFSSIFNIYWHRWYNHIARNLFESETIVVNSKFRRNNICILWKKKNPIILIDLYWDYKWFFECAFCVNDVFKMLSSFICKG